MTTTRRFLVLHGAGNHRPPQHWQYWLVEELRRRREVVLYPQLPAPEAPDLEAWLDLAHAEARQLGEGERTVICHSLSVLVWFHLAGRLAPQERVDRVLLVSAPSPAGLWPEVMPFVPGPELSSGALRRAAGQTRFVCSDNDPYCPEGAANFYARPLGLAVDVIPGGGHLSIDDGYGPWPSVLAWCLEADQPVEGNSAAVR